MPYKPMAWLSSPALQSQLLVRATQSAIMPAWTSMACSQRIQQLPICPPEDSTVVLMLQALTIKFGSGSCVCVAGGLSAHEINERARQLQACWEECEHATQAVTATWPHLRSELHRQAACRCSPSTTNGLRQSSQIILSDPHFCIQFKHLDIA